MLISNGKSIFRSFNATFYHQASSKFNSHDLSNKLKQYGIFLPKIKLYSKDFSKTVPNLSAVKNSYGADQIQVSKSLIYLYHICYRF